MFVRLTKQKICRRTKNIFIFSISHSLFYSVKLVLHYHGKLHGKTRHFSSVISFHFHTVVTRDKIITTDFTKIFGGVDL